MGNSSTTNHPDHYNKGLIEVWDFIIDQNLDFIEGNIVKYICRYKLKGGYEDLLKAKQYMDKLYNMKSKEQHKKDLYGIKNTC